ncbi:tRNA (cytidine(34)-2'-O)-methyltransferase [Candidatus Odyssella thessalonicensis]|uniref:tRNA (cytidine(34)-2'-O)-methyltransferase n=1 Tax=Candidatus Odyssella thessalonicensis TaxID=84647 RepID=UPI000527FC8E|nr:tRNA (cytidine(34)-2'-O)-methyltransferase [Candidatus Odyssella thessalonicensis]
MRLALYQPEIPQNAGTLMRLAACLGVPLDIIEPCGFIWQDQKLQRAGMDYIELANVQRHASFEAFKANIPQRLILVDTKAATSFLDFSFQKNDILLMGKESVGVPESVFEAIPDRVIIPMLPGRRSLNVAVAAAMVLGEALRQTNGFKRGDIYDNARAESGI